MKKVIIVGYQGQDGKFLWDIYKKKNYSIIGIGRKKVECYNINYNDLVDIKNSSHVKKLISYIKPDYLFFVAAYHHSSEEEIVDLKKLYNNSYSTNCQSYIYFLDCIANYSPNTRIFYASSAHIFGDKNFKVSVDESFPYSPNSIYGITKLISMNIGKYYRDNKSLFVSNGILFGHESIYRDKKFVSKKIVNTAIKIYYGVSNKLLIGDLNALVDWGYAGDFVSAYIKILEHKNADDFIIGTGKVNKIKFFVKIVFDQLGLEWKKYVVVNKNIIKRSPYCISANFSKLNKATGWKPKYDLEALAKKLVNDEMKLYKKTTI